MILNVLVNFIYTVNEIKRVPSAESEEVNFVKFISLLFYFIFSCEICVRVVNVSTVNILSCSEYHVCIMNTLR